MLGPFAKVLLVLHAVAAVVLVGSVTHLGWLGVQRLRGRPVRDRLVRLYRRIVDWAYAATFGLGLLVYPSFRVNVRGGGLDESAPLAVGFFEVKEYWLGLGLLMVGALAVLDRPTPSRESSAAHVRLSSWLAVALTAVVWLAFFTGLTLTAIEPV